jgi:S1-C subfamily serine protease
LTAAHVVGDNQTVKIKNEEGAVVDGRVLFVDKAHDLAVVEADVHAKIAKVKCAIVKPGTEFSMYGNPVSREFVYSWGRIASAPRKFSVAESAYIVDATIISGNSGGGAFDKYGNMIGAVIAIQTIDISENSPMEALSITGFGFVVDGPTICNFLDKNNLTYRH